jgi:endonuclease/exonuclease/phosphatase family metal-dependent hydrolase
VWGVAALAAFGLAACDAPTTPVADADASFEAIPASVVAARTGGPAGEAFFRVYTQNVFLGGDTGPLFSLDFSQLPANILDVVTAVATFWGEVQASDVAARAAAIVDEIEALDPHVVGLQEVASFAVVDLTTGPPTILDGRDYLAVLLGQMAARGLDYQLVGPQINVNSQLPIGLGATGVTQVLAFTLGEAVLVRGDLPLADVEMGNYAALIDLGPVQIGRGYTRVETVFDGSPWHVITTHLETQGVRPVHDAQAQELYARFGALPGVTVLMGDLNSDAEGVDGDPSWTPTYGFLTANGFVDLWPEKTGRDEVGYTCCREPDLMTGALDERIDFVLVKPPEGVLSNGNEGLPGAVHMEIVGDEMADVLYPSGLYPADHAGLFAGFNVPRGLRTQRGGR